MGGGEIMAEIIASLIAENTGDEVHVEVSPHPRHFTKLSILSGTNFVISPLRDLISLPLRIRRIQYAKTDVASHPSLDLDASIKRVLRNATEILTMQIGEDRSQLWATDTFMRINRILAGRGPNGILNGADAITRKIHRDELDEVVESLEFLFTDGYKPIATRRYKYWTPPLFLEGFEAEVNGKHAPIYEELLMNLKSLSDATEIFDSDRFHHLFFWSDLPLTEFQPSLIERVVRDCTSRYRSPNQHSGKVLIFCSLPNTQNHILKQSFSPHEKLALKRAFGGGIIYLAPGKNTDIYTDPIKKANRPESVLNSSDFTGALEHRMSQIGLDELRIVDELRYAVHESTSDLVDNSAFVIVSDCWTGTWTQSKEIDGEQVMS